MSAQLPDLSIRQLEYLVAVVDSPTWSAAAAHRGVSPSALSQGLAELERRVGVPLFERDGRRRLLRSEARPVLEHARQILALTGDLMRWASQTGAGERGIVRVGMIDIAAIHHYPEILGQFRGARPDVQLRLEVAPSGQLLEELSRGLLDLVVCVKPPQLPPGLDATEVKADDLAIYRPDGRRAGPPERWGPWVLFPEGSHSRDVIERELRVLGAAVEVVAVSHQPDVLREMVHLGLGWTVLPVVQAESSDRPLRRARILTRRHLIMATRAQRSPNPAADALQSALVG